MSKIFAVVNQKGGVGKTTTSVNLAASFASYGKRVLLVDMDPQGNATMGCGVEKNSLDTSVYEVLVGENTPEEALQHCAGKFDLLPANADLTAAEVELLTIENKEHRLRQALGRMKNGYDYLIIDCPPSLNMLTVNSLVACDGVIIPMQCEYYALEGLTALITTIRKIGKHLNPGLGIEGILRTMYDPRNSLTNEVSDQLLSHFGDKVYRICIPRNVRLAEAPSFGLSALAYDKNSKGAIAYLGLAGEIIRRGKAVRRKQAETINAEAG